jgi:hypothetical protein
MGNGLPCCTSDSSTWLSVSYASKKETISRSRKSPNGLGLSQTQIRRTLPPDIDATVPRPMSPPKTGWKRILRAAGISERTTLHDLRPTLATWMIRTGASLTAVAAGMGHKDIRTTQKHYAWADMDLVRRVTSNFQLVHRQAPPSTDNTSRSEMWVIDRVPERTHLMGVVREFVN